MRGATRGCGRAHATGCGAAGAHGEGATLAGVAYSATRIASGVPALAAILRIHKIDPALIGELAVSLQEEIKEISANAPYVEVEFQPSENKISAELRANGNSRIISTTW